MGPRWSVALSPGGGSDHRSGVATGTPANIGLMVRQAGPTDTTALRRARRDLGTVLASLPDSTRVLQRVMTGGNP